MAAVATSSGVACRVNIFLRCAERKKVLPLSPRAPMEGDFLFCDNGQTLISGAKKQ
jgi:hypothetical protein